MIAWTRARRCTRGRKVEAPGLKLGELDQKQGQGAWFRKGFGVLTRWLSQLSRLVCSEAFRLPFGQLVKREEAGLGGEGVGAAEKAFL